ncbi:SDR family NAD(P)-dependent oxidoreductase [Streptomyces sp. NPDC087425]|uniref:SDR family NAD(P)-dependent oxidoreductase n=1 Tax=Streptomyces sp. NPDC087425 TaxID=3365787 RepID=UPI00380F3493
MAVTEDTLRDYLKRATTDLARTRRELTALQERADEPIAIVGMACRYPGDVASPEDLWRLVANGVDATGDFPTDRGWDLDALAAPEGPATSYVQRGAFVRDADRFDGPFFGISPREVLGMAPAQRLALETAWEALERAGLDPAALRGSDTGVYLGVMDDEYGPRMDDPGEAGGHVATGNQVSVASGRISYTFGFHGPALSVDTACSSSLVALHLAVAALRRGECSLALTGGVTFMSGPGTFVQFSLQGGLSRDGRCKSFAAGADGTGWGEGAGMLVVERLCDARRNGHQVLAVIRGTAVNQDGASNGLTAPNGPAQEKVIRQALAAAGLSADGVDAVEAHGTGTVLGDPLEASALIATYGQGRPAERPLLLGSVKSNIGHTQAAAGVAGVIKMVMAMRHGLFPATLHLDEPTPHVDWNGGGVVPLGEAVPWPESGRPRRAGVSSFGVSGTNAHVIVEAPEEEPADPSHAPAPGAPAFAWPLSGKGDAALAAQAARLNEAVPDADPADIAVSLAARAGFEQRAVVIAPDAATARALTDTVAAGEDAEGGVGVGGLVRGQAPVVRRRPVFVFPGQGAQWVGMGVELLDTAPVFAAAIADCEAALAPHVDWSLTEVLRAGPEAGWLERVDVVQPVSFAVMVALARLWESAGVTPTAVVGHSQGEIAAAHIAGLLPLEQAARVVALRSRAITALAGQGGMVSLPLSEADTADLLAPWTGRIEIAAVNGPALTVVSGDTEAVEELLAACPDARRIPVDYASHSHHVERIEAELATLLGDIAPEPGRIPLYSSVTGEDRTVTATDGAYWYRNLRRPVRFEAALRAALTAGHDAFIEVSPHPVATVGVTQTVEESGAAVASTLRREQGSWARMLTALAEAWVQGIPVDWTAPHPGGRRVPLPTYAFQRTRHWLDRASSGGPGQLTGAGLQGTGHPLLSAAAPVADTGQWLLTGRLSLRTHPWLADHAVSGRVLLPGTAFAELAVTAGDVVGCPAVDELTLHTPLSLTEGEARRLQVHVEAPDDDGRRALTLSSAPDSTSTWTRHASGTLTTIPAAAPDTLTLWPPPATEPLPVDGLYATLADAGYGYGPAFQGLRAVHHSGDDLYADVELPGELTDTAGQFGLHPALLDAALHALRAADWFPGAAPRLPFHWSGVHLHATGATRLRVRLRRTGTGEITLLAADTTGAPVLTVDTLTLRESTGATLATPVDHLYEVTWTPVETPAGGAVAEATAATAPVSATATGSETVPDATVVHCATALEALDAVRSDAPRLVIVTRGAVATGPADPAPDPELAAVWGLIRSAQSEQPDRFLLVDVGSGPDDGAGRGENGHAPATDATGTSQLAPNTPAIAAALASGEPQLAYRAGRLYAPRLTPAAPALVPPAAPAWRLTATGSGTLEGLEFAAYEPASRPLAPGEVRVGVRATGVNFRDVLITLGMVEKGAGLGYEAAGVVLETGADVTGLAVGDRVTGLVAGDGYGPVTVTDQHQLARVPDGWSFVEAASVPIAYLTASYGLVDLAGLKAGEKVLIHAAAGGVGMAAVQIARHLGAEVFGTASPGKWDTLRELGLDDAHIANSRDLEFEQRFPKVDVVLDSLAGEFVDASLRLLGDGGRFVEMGKTDIRDADEVAAQHPGLSYRAFDLREAGPRRTREMLTEVLGLLEAGAYTLLPITTWDVRRAPEALRYVSQARHIGKVVLTVPRPLDPDGTVLITGATGTLGRLVARHLVTRHGARRLLLVGRRGSAATGMPELQAELEELGADVTVAACDVADRDALAALVAEHRLSAVVHAAGVLDDGVVPHLTPERLEKVLRPKSRAARALHDLTLAHDLTHFVLFSSVAGIIGTAGQANYAAANAALDALAQRRSRAGLPALSLAWGLWEQASGMTGHLGAADRARLAGGGALAMTDTEGLALLDAALDAGTAAVVPAKLDTARLTAPVPALLRSLVRTPARRAAVSGADTGTGLVDRLAALPEADRAAEVLALVRDESARVLGLTSPDAVEPDRPLREHGLDSLLAVELRNRVSARVRAKLPATLLFDHPTPRRLAAHLLTSVLGVTGPTAAQRTRAEPVATDEPIAIVSMACRLPGDVHTPEDLWRLVLDGRDAVGPFPADRWDVDALYDPDPETPGTSYAREGGFLSDIGSFDAGFFGIAPKEAAAMDPQQRLLLETTWEALERANIVPADLAGSTTGVYLGLFDSGYHNTSGLDRMDGYVTTGSAVSVASGRLAYALGLGGPAMSVDTACSSSLVALHLAVQALRAGECDLALTGGVTLMVTPRMFVEFSRLRGVSATGRCRSFSDDADGAIWAEGVGMVVLKRLTDAQRDGDEILAVVRGTAVNQDGRSQGLSAPNGPAQEEAIRHALARSGLTPADIDTVEAHGTGTTLGDPIEANALAAVFGATRPEGRPLRIGSLKSNIGHAQAASGIAGLIKVVQSLRHETLPRTLHAAEPSRHVAWEGSGLALLQDHLPWTPAADRVRRAGISSFGISGTNVHAVIEEAPAPVTDARAETPAAPGLFTLSGRTPDAVRAQAARLAGTVAENAALPELAYTLARHRTHFDRRAAVVAKDRDQLRTALDALASGDTPLPSGAGEVPAGKVAFVFPGHGGQWPGMGRELAQQSTAFREELARIDEAVRRIAGWSVLDALSGAEFDRTEILQPVLFALNAALAAAWRELGIRPDAVLGHSLGEIAAAYAAGALTLDAAVTVVTRRARAVVPVERQGGMLAVELPHAEVADLLTPYAGRLFVAAVNSARSTAISGTSAELAQLRSELDARDIRTRELSTPFASHTPLMAAVRETFLNGLDGLAATPGTLPFYSAVTAEPTAGEALDPGYWYANLAEPVRFADAVRRMLDDGYRWFVELSPHPSLAASIEAVAAEAGVRVVTVGSLRREQGELLTGVGKLYTAGYDPDWSALFPAGRPAPLPTYPFARERHWTAPAPAPRAGATPFVDTHIEQSDEPGRHVFQTRVDLRDPRYAYLADHRVLGEVWLPGAAFLEMAFEAASRLHKGDLHLTDIQFVQPLRLDEQTPVDVQLTLRADTFTIASRTPGTPWTPHATGHLAQAPLSTEAPLAAADSPLAALRAECATEVPSVYADFTAAGIDYGPAFRGLAEGWSGEEAALGRLTARPLAGHLIHPAVLDAAFHAAALPDAVPSGRPFVPAAIGALRLTGRTTPVWTTCRVRSVDDDRLTLDVTLLDQDGRPVLEIDGFELAALAAQDRSLMEVRWQPRPAPQQPPCRGTWLILADGTGVGDDLAARLGTEPYVIARSGTGFTADAPGRYTLDPAEPAHLSRLLDEAFAGELPTTVVQLTALDAPAIDSAETADQATRLTCLSTLHLVRALTERPRQGKAPRLFLVTRASQAADGTGVAHPAQALAWGFGLTVAQEHPELTATLVDLPATGGTDALWTQLRHADAELLIALRESGRLVPRLARAQVTDSTEVPLDGVQLITGGLGGLGRVVAERLVARGARKLALLGRGAPAPDAVRWADGLREQGVEIVMARADVTDRAALTAALDTVRTGLGAPVTAVVHAAGVLDDATLANLTEERVRRVLAPKVLGTTLLAELTPDARSFVLFSSVAGLFGSAGQAPYAAANAFLDAWAHHVERPALSLDWGAWEEAGMAAATAGRTASGGRRALLGLTPQEGGALFDRALTSGARQLAPAALDWPFLARTPESVRALPLLADLVATPDSAPTDLVAQILADPDPDAELVETYVRTKVAEVTGDRVTGLAPTTSLKELGLDSLMIVQLRNAFGRDLLVDLPTSVVFAAADIRGLAADLRTALADGAPRTRSAPDEPEGEVPSSAVFPATRDVVRLLRTAQQGVPDAAHAIGLALRLPEPTTRERLTGIVDRLAARHAALRTAVVAEDRALRVDRELPGPLLRWTSVQAADPEADAADRLRALLEPAFDLATPSLWRFELLDHGPGGQILVFGAHHAVSDLQSLLLLTDELDAELSGTPLPAEITNRDVTLLLRSQETGANGGEGAVDAEWTAAFDGVRRLDLTLAAPRPEQRSYRAGSLTLPVPDGLMDRVAARAGALAITPAAFCLGTFTVLLARLRERERFVLAVPVDTRIHVDAPGALGFFGVPVPFPAEAREAERVEDVLRRTDGRLEKVLEQGAMFSDTLAELAAQGLYQAGAPLVEVYFNYVRSAPPAGGVDVLPAGTGYSDLDLMVTLTPDAGRVRLDYNADILDAATTFTLGQEFLELLAEAAQRPEALVRPERERRRPVLALAATFALGDLPVLCEAALDDTHAVEEAPYHQVLAALKDPSGALHAPDTALGVILLRATDLERFGPADDALLAELAAAYPSAVRELARRTGTPLIVGIAPTAGPDARLARWETEVADALDGTPGVAVLRPADWTRDHQVEDPFDTGTEELAHLPFTPEFQAALALTLAETVNAVRRPAPKVIAVDGDETLWGGIAGEIGPEAVELGGARAQLARRLLQWREAGALLMLVSNNDEATVRAVLDRPESLLDAEHFSVLSAAWGPKPERLQEAARRLNLGVDSFLFLDDNPAELAKMRAALPQVHSVPCPPAGELAAFLDRLWPLVPAAATAEDRLRARFYEQERARDAVRTQTGFEEFLASLELAVEIRPVTDEDAPRAAQLVRRTNQFTLRARSADGRDLERWREHGEVWTATARDRYGDYGQIGLLAVRADAGQLDVLAWTMSCRALGRGVEERLLAWLAERAEQLDCAKVRFTARRTERNIPVRRLLAALGGGEADTDHLETVTTPDQLREFRSWR